MISPVNSPGPCGDDRALAREIRLHDLHASGEQDEKRDFGVVGLKQDLARLNLAQLAAGAETTDLRRRQDWKGLGVSIERTR